MKALSIRQPWAWLIVEGYKDIENRDWYTTYRGQLLIHAAKTLRSADYRFAVDYAYKRGVIVPPARELPLGGIVGAVTLIDCVTSYKSVWFQGNFGFVLANASTRPFVACNGRLGIFEVTGYLETSRTHVLD